MKGKLRLVFSGILITGFYTLLMMLNGCQKYPRNITMEPRSSLEYAIELEAIFGPLPRFSCSDAIEIPFYKNGNPIPADGSWNVQDCDCPTAFGKPCDPGYKVGRYEGLNNDGSRNTDVVWITNCRDGGMGVIGYKFSTGETCFLHVVLGIDVESRNIPIPSEQEYADAWQAPNVVAADKCMNCHQAGPFVHSPAVDQLRLPGDSTQLLVPMTGKEAYSIVGVEFQQPITTDEIQNSCTSCHRPQCTDHFENFPLDELVMPPPFENATDFDHSSISIADRQAIRDWCKTLNL